MQTRSRTVLLAVAAVIACVTGGAVVVLFIISANSRPDVEEAVRRYVMTNGDDDVPLIRVLQQPQLTEHEEEVLRRFVRTDPSGYYQVSAYWPGIITFQDWQCSVDLPPSGGAASWAIADYQTDRLTFSLEQREDYLRKFISGEEADILKAKYIICGGREEFLRENWRSLAQLADDHLDDHDGLAAVRFLVQRLGLADRFPPAPESEADLSAWCRQVCDYLIRHGADQ